MKNIYSNQEYEELSSAIKDTNSTDIYARLTEFGLPFLDKNFVTIDNKVSHVFNANGYRGPEFGLKDIVAAGCSQTYGIGVEERHTWPAVLSKMTKMSYVNLGVPGISFDSVVESVIFYLKTYGIPKYVCVVFPSLYRFSFIEKEGLTVFPYPKTTFDFKNQISFVNATLTPSGSIMDETKNWPSISKRPHDISKILPYEYVLYLNMKSLNHLIEYCKAAGTKLIFTTWYEDTEKFLSEKQKKSLNLDMSGYIVPEGLSNFTPPGSLLSTCHPQNDPPEYWQVGLDPVWHMGAHGHLHFAEMFAEKIGKNGQ